VSETFAAFRRRQEGLQFVIAQQNEHGEMKPGTSIAWCEREDHAKSIANMMNREGAVLDMISSGRVK
jgi:hypothetical protein